MKTLLPLIIILTIFLAPDLAFAQADVSPDGIYTGGGLIPCGQDMDNKCNSCHVVILANTVVKWLIGITFMIFAGMAVYSGIKLVMSGGNSHAKQDAKEMFTNVFIGLLIILGAWLMIDTLLRYVLKGGETGEIAGYGPWSQVKCVSETEASITKMLINEAEFEAADPNDTTVYDGKPSTSDRCNPIPDSQLATIPSYASHGKVRKALPDTVNRYMAMYNAAKKAGISISAGSAYRSPDEQLATWNALGCKLVDGKGVCRKSAAAVPCALGGKGSNHTLGTAIDISTSGAGRAWLEKNGPTYGFKWKNIPKDPWHYSPTGG